MSFIFNFISSFIAYILARWCYDKVSENKGIVVNQKSSSNGATQIGIVMNHGSFEKEEA